MAKKVGKYKPGMVVWMKSGGPPLVVERYAKAGHEQATPNEMVYHLSGWNRTGTELLEWCLPEACITQDRPSNGDSVRTSEAAPSSGA